jgi:hypothetical protein
MSRTLNEPLLRQRFTTSSSDPKSPLSRILLIAFTLVLSAEAVANIHINYLGKGRTWDLYPVAEAIWVAGSVVAVTFCASMRPTVLVLIALLFLDSWVDLCAMGHPCWWAGPPVLIEWKWNTLGDEHRLYPLLYAYWTVTWAMQVPLRCILIARTLTRTWGRPFLLVTLGLNLIWFTAPQDVLFYFVWLGRYDRHEPYFSYLPPEGFWNLWNMLLLRVPLGVTCSALLIRAGYRNLRGWITMILIACALIAIALYAAIFLRLLFSPA